MQPAAMNPSSPGGQTNETRLFVNMVPFRGDQRLAHNADFEALLL